MKTNIILATALAASAIFLTSCDKGSETKGGGDAKTTTSGGGGATVSEADAIANFKKEFGEVKAMKTAGDSEKDPMAQMTILKPMLAKMQAIKTEGLPADLKTAWEEMKVKLGEMSAMFKDMPEKKEDMMAWAQKTFTDPAMMGKMQKLAEEGKVIGEKLKEVGKKYDMNLDMDEK